MTRWSVWEQQTLTEYREMHARGEYEKLCKRFCHEGLYVDVKQDWRQMPPEAYEAQRIPIEEGSVWVAGLCSHEESGPTRADAVRKLADWIVAKERFGC